MAYIDNNQKIDLLWKKLEFGVSQTSPDKSAYEELTRSGQILRASEIWQQDSLIPTSAAAIEGVVEFVDIRCRMEPSVTDNSAWVAVQVYEDGITPSNRLRDFISPIFDPSYEIKVYKDLAKTQRIFNSSIETNWVFDYSSGILWLPGLSETTAPASVYITGFRYVGAKGLNPTFSGSLIDVLTNLTDGSFAGGYIPGWVENETKISDAIDQINRALLDFIPRAPNTLVDYTLEMTGAIQSMDDANIVLSADAVNNTNGMPFAPLAGQAVERVVGLNLETTYVGPFGSGNSGTLSVDLNNASAGQIALSDGDNTGVYGNLELNQDTSANSANDSKFYETLIARAVGLNLPKGLNGIRLTHSETGSTNTLWVVRDSTNIKPTITSLSVTEPEGNIYTYSSGIPHLTRGAIVYLNATVNDLATDIHLDTRNVEFQTTPKMAGPHVWTYPGVNELPSVLTKGTIYSPSNVQFNIADYDGNLGHGSVNFKAIARNANGKTEFIGTQQINYMRGGTPTGISPVDESSIPIFNLGSYEEGFAQYAVRVLTETGNSPNISLPDGIPVFDHTEPLPVHEASILGGSVRCLRENLANHIPSGPDYSGHLDTQYITFAIQRKNVSIMNIEVEGRYSGLQIKLLGITDLNRTTNGWMDCFKHYEGWGVPGREVGNGCAVGNIAFGGTQTVTATFGYESSSNATHNLILVRFKMIGNDSITGLRFSGVFN